ncbi:MAG: hypothetical protein NTZ68_02590 [Candidatus Dependentiae bacterium]|nr:hypothetical protein [Candidatus Dependentiae bacterium]
MKFFTRTNFMQFLILSSVFSGDLLASNDKKNDLAKRLQIKSEDITFILGGKYKQEYFGANNLGFFNSKIANDSSSYLRTTADYFADIIYGEISRPRVMFHDTLRFRYRWGGTTEVKSFDGIVDIGGIKVKTKGTNANKHLMWTREAWVKMAIGNLDYPNNNYFQMGLLDYQVGRGISFGSAYTVEGFLGFAPGYSIDQFAPAILFNLNPIVETYDCQFYVALLENNHGSYSSNVESIRANEIGGCAQRGIGRHSYVALINNKLKLLNGAKHKLHVEPYVVYQAAPDQDLEFLNDVDSYLTTYGCAVEAVSGRFNIGGEAAINTGERDARPWDRNDIVLTRNDQGFVTAQYTKVFIDDPSTTKSPKRAYVTDANAAAVKNSPRDPSLNGKEIGTNLFNKVDITTNPVTNGTGILPYKNLYNAFDRFRPRERQFLKGYFFVSDASYQFIDKVLTGSLGIGYASGHIDPQRDANKMTSTELMNQQFAGFIPLQSAYQGTRLSHLVIFNLGVPRFNTRNPRAELINTNVIKYSQSDGINEMTNIAFFGSRFSWNVQSLKAYKLNIAPNLIGYWSPETTHVVVSPKGVLPERTIPADNYIGTELSVQIAAYFYDKIKIEGYAGMVLPGQYYTDLCGTPFGKEVTGDDIGYVANFGLVYAF